MEEIALRPNRIPWPPLILAITVAVGYLLHKMVPLSELNGFFDTPHVRLIGNGLFYGGLALDAASMLTMFWARTNILPHRAAGKLVTTGPFAFTRNPIYVGNTLLMIGLALAWANSWLLALSLFAGLAVDRLAIRREERHLLAVFGGTYQHYMDSVPRWVGLRKKQGI